MSETYKIILAAVVGIAGSLIIGLVQDNNTMKESEKIRLHNDLTIQIQKDYGRKIDSLFNVTREENKTLRQQLTTIKEGLQSKGTANSLLTKKALRIIEDTIIIDEQARDSIYEHLKKL